MTRDYAKGPRCGLPVAAAHAKGSTCGRPAGHKGSHKSAEALEQVYRAVRQRRAQARPEGEGVRRRGHLRAVVDLDPGTIRTAAEIVARHAADDRERAELLAMLGLEEAS